MTSLSYPLVGEPMAKQSFELPTAVDCPRSILQGETGSSTNPSDRNIMTARVLVSNTPALTRNPGASDATASRSAGASSHRERRTHGPIERPPRLPLPTANPGLPHQHGKER